MTDHFSGATLKTAAKLVILEKYLKPYAQIIGNNFDNSWYVDTHAGTGKTRAKNGALLDGSALIALSDYTDHFDRFYFYELDINHFHKLHETITQELDIEFDVYKTPVEGHDFMVAASDDPRIRIMQMDSNDGVSFLAEHAQVDAHWFAFIDPRGLTARRSTIDTLIQRGHMDILINYQTTGVMRSAAKGAEHAHDAVTRTLGDNDWEAADSPDDYVRMFENRLEENEEFSVVTKNLEAPRDKDYRFDLVFASGNDTARRIIQDIWDADGLWDEANDKLGQSGLGDFY